ncbi:hypothetical protein TWF569_007216 [Orbilia oligospora]|nr:hypothetical protein TWF569_007216 [Orbilia oligospora]
MCVGETKEPGIDPAEGFSDLTCPFSGSPSEMSMNFSARPMNPDKPDFRGKNRQPKQDRRSGSAQTVLCRAILEFNLKFEEHVMLSARTKEAVSPHTASKGFPADLPYIMISETRSEQFVKDLQAQYQCDIVPHEDVSKNP